MIFAMLHNIKTDRYHPIIFRPAPMPGDMDLNTSSHRYKSVGHHTLGFDTFDEAQEDVNKMCEEHGYTDSGTQYDWDGEDVPAKVVFLIQHC